MPRFLKLPSGVVINLALISRIAPHENGGASVYFGNDDTVSIDSKDADFLMSRLGASASSAFKTAVFWMVIAVAVILVYLAVRAR